MKYSFLKTIIPNKVINYDECKIITRVHSDYIIKEFEVYTNNETKKIEKIIITKGNHPNCDPKTKIHCIPELLKTLELNKFSLNLIIKMFKVFDFNSAYYKPWDLFECKEMDYGFKKI